MRQSQAMLPSLPPLLEADLRGKYTPEQYMQWVDGLAAAEKRKRRKYKMLLDIGVVNPYKSIYQGLEDGLEKMQAKQCGDLALLGLDANASLCKRDVRNAYRRKARKLHPDVGGDAEAFKRMHAAYRKVLAATPK